MIRGHILPGDPGSYRDCGLTLHPDFVASLVGTIIGVLGYAVQSKPDRETKGFALGYVCPRIRIIHAITMCHLGNRCPILIHDIVVALSNGEIRLVVCILGQYVRKLSQLRIRVRAEERFKIRIIHLSIPFRI